ncbi:MAG: putative zinc-binding protein [Promethearchaeia archaeon]
MKEKTKPEKKWEAGVNTHENVIFSCFSEFSNTGLTSMLASLEVVRTLGLQKVTIGNIGAVVNEYKKPVGKALASKKIITVDGSYKQCVKNILLKAGIPITKNFNLGKDIGLKKKPLCEDIGGDLKEIMSYVSNENIQKAKELIIKSII